MIPAEALAQHVAIVGTVGAGKTFTAKGVVEGLLDAGKRVCIIDPTSAWWGLRLLADGQSAGFKIAILGGEHGDIPLGEAMGGKVGELIGTRNMPAVVDLSEMLIGERHKFVTEFAESLFRHNRTPLHLVIDEADEFMPQNPLPESRRMLHHIDRIIRRGRIRGFRVTMITQRPATLHKNALTQANTLIAMRLTSPQDRRAVEEWVKGNADAEQAKEVLGSLASLKRGTGWLWCPSLGILQKTAFPAITTFDSSRSPEEGDELHEPVALAPVDIAELRASLSGPLIKNPKPNEPACEESRPSNMVEKSNTSDAELEIAARNAAKAGYEAGLSEGKRIAVQALGQFARDLANAIGDAKEATERAHLLMDSYAGFVEAMDAEATKAAKNIPENIHASPKASGTQESPSQRKQIPAFTQSVKPPVKHSANGADHRPSEGLSRPQARILDALAWLESVGIRIADRPRTALLADQSHRSSGFEKNISTLRSAGLIEYPSAGDLRLTAEGRKRAHRPSHPPTTDGLHRAIQARVSGPQWRMLDALCRAYPRPLKREVLAERSDQSVKSSGFEKNLSTLRSFGFVDYPSKGEAVATDVMFIEGGN